MYKGAYVVIIKDNFAYVSVNTEVVGVYKSVSPYGGNSIAVSDIQEYIVNVTIHVSLPSRVLEFTAKLCTRHRMIIKSWSFM